MQVSNANKSRKSGGCRPAAIDQLKAVGTYHFGGTLPQLAEHVSESGAPVQFCWVLPGYRPKTLDFV